MVEISLHCFPVCRQAGQTVRVKRTHHICQQRYGMEVIINDDRHKDVELEITLTCRHGNGGIVRHYLHCDHGNGLTLRGVDLARHDRRARFILRNADFSDAAART